MFGDSASGNLKDFHVREEEHLFSQRVSFVCPFLMEPFLKDGNLQLLLIDGVAKKDDLFVFLIGIHLRQTFQVSFSDSPGESGCEDGGFNNQCNRGINNLDILCHNLYLKVNKTMGNYNLTAEL